MNRKEWQAIEDARKLLSLGDKATLGEIKRAYHRLSKEHHPDVAENDRDTDDDTMYRLTAAYNLPARHVIHTVGPVYRGDVRDRALLAACYRNSLQLAADRRVTSIAFPAISCGAYGYPIEEACRIAVDTVAGFLKTGAAIDRVVFVLFSAQDAAVYRRQLARRATAG